MNKLLIVMLLVGFSWMGTAQAGPYMGEALPSNELVIDAMNEVNDPSWFMGFINRIEFIGHTKDDDTYRLYYTGKTSTEAHFVTLIRLDTGLWILPYIKNNQNKHYIIQR